MSGSNLWSFIISIYNFIIGVFRAFENLWVYEFTLPGIIIGTEQITPSFTLTFPMMLTSLLITLMLALLVKKFIPVA